MDVGEAFLLVFSAFLAVGDLDGGWGRVAFVVKEVESTMGDGRVAQLEKSMADLGAGMILVTHKLVHWKITH